MRSKYQWGRGFSFGTILQAEGSTDAQANPTLAAGDVKISKDGGAFANLGTLPSVDPASGVRVKVTLSDAECQAKEIMIRFDDAAGAEWKQQTMILSMMDPRENMVPLKVPSGFDERSNVTSSNITRTNHPTYGILYTSGGTPTQYDFDTRQLLGALVWDETNGTGFTILGGYFFADDASDVTRQVFGVCKDPDQFGMTEGGTVAPNDNWTGADDESTYGNGWTFIVQATDQTYPSSSSLIYIYTRPGAVFEPTYNDMIDARQIHLENDNAEAFKAVTTKADTNAVYYEGMGAGAGLYSQGGDTGAGGSFEGGSSGGSGLYAKGNGAGYSGIVGYGATEGGAGFWGLGFLGYDGANFQGGATGNGISATAGATSGDGIAATAGADGHGIEAKSGGTSGNGIYAWCDNGSVSYAGLALRGNGSSSGIWSSSESADGIKADGGGTAGNGIIATGAGNGNGMRVVGGNSGDGIYASGGVAGGNGFTGISQANNEHGMELIGHGTGRDFYADEIGAPVNLNAFGASLAGNMQDIYTDVGGASAAEVWAYVIHGTGGNQVTAQEAVAEIHSYSALPATRNTVSGAITYQDADGDTAFTLTPATTGRTRS